MRDNPNITTAELHNILGVSETAVENNISFLRENGYIERVGSKKAGYWNLRVSYPQPFSQLYSQPYLFSQMG